jgi:hypothetical protein
MTTNLLLAAIAVILLFGFLSVMLVLVEIRDACYALRDRYADWRRDHE